METLELIPTSVIPSNLIYEEMDGKPVYYRGYRDVLTGEKNAEDIMGASEMQWAVVSLLIKMLNRHFDEKYLVASNEAGLHLRRRTNFSADVALYEIAQFAGRTFSNQYSDIPPRLIIEVDIRGEMADPLDNQTYYFKKTEKLLDFGVQQLIWFFTDVRKVVLAEPGRPWLTMDWDAELTVLGQHTFSFKTLIETSGLPFAFPNDEA